MLYNKELFSSVKKQKMTTNAFFCYVGQITNNNIMNILLVDERFVNSVIDSDKVYQFRLNLKYKKKKLFQTKPKCIITGRHRAKIRFFGHISRFQLKEMVCEGKFLIGISRFGW